MKVSRRHGRVQLRLEAVEAAVLGQLLDELDDVLAGDPQAPGDDAEARRRLYPAAYADDETAAADYRALTESGLRDERRERLATCRAELAADGDADLGLDADAGERWIRVLNDLRLSLGTRLGVTEDTDGTDLDPADPQAQPWLLYYWLTATQDSVVQALAR